MRIALDTNRYTDFCKADPAVVERLETAEKVLMPFAETAELRAGFGIGTRSAGNESALQQFPGKPGSDVLYASKATTRCYASLFRQLRQQGTPVPTNDLWIAALVMGHGLVLCTRDRHLPQIPEC